MNRGQVGQAGNRIAAISRSRESDGPGWAHEVAKEWDVPRETAEWVGGSSDRDWWWFLQWSEYFRLPRFLRYLAFRTAIVYRM